MSKISRYFFIILFLGCLSFSGYEIVSTLWNYYIGEKIYSDASSNISVIKDSSFDIMPNIVTTNDIDDENDIIEEDVVEPLVSLDIDWSKFENFNDVIGWIVIDGNDTINYPVVQSFDNTYYLKHLYDGTSNTSGSIFTSMYNHKFDDKHTIIYGHNMKNGSMFSSIKKYRDQKYADEHRYIYIATPDGNTRIFYVYSCFLTDVYGDSDGFNAYKYSFMSDDEYKIWIDSSIKKSEISTNDIDISTNSNIITLSTCMSRGTKTERCVVNAVEIENVKK